MKLITQEIARKVPALYATENAENPFETGARLMRAWESAGVQYQITRAEAWENASKGAYWLERIDT
jgi:hypothetical protein